MRVRVSLIPGGSNIPYEIVGIRNHITVPLGKETFVEQDEPSILFGTRPEGGSMIFNSFYVECHDNFVLVGSSRLPAGKTIKDSIPGLEFEAIENPPQVSIEAGC